MQPVRWWDERAVPRLVDVVLGERTSAHWRDRVAHDARGTVLEIGFGSGRNLPYFSRDVSHVLAVEPSELAWERAQERIREFTAPVTHIGLDGARLAVEDGSVDAVVSTWTMCTIPDLQGALTEVRRVLRPGGMLHFVEHSLAPDRMVRAAQRRLQPLWGMASGGCHLDRDIPGALADAGLSTEWFSAEYVVDLAPAKPFAWFCTGRAG